MNIKSVAILIGPETTGTFRNLTIDLTKGLSELGINKIYVIYLGKSIDSKNYSKNVEFIKLNVNKIRWMTFGLVPVLNKLNIDILISMLAGNNIAAILAKLLSKNKKFKLIISEHSKISSYNSFNDNSKDFRHKMELLLVRLLYGFSDGLYVVSEDIKQDLINKVHIKLSEEKMRIIFNPVDIDRIKEMSTHPVKHKWLNSKKYPVIISVGRLAKQKNYSVLLESFSKLLQNVDAKLIIIGDGSERKNLEKIVSNLNIKNEVDFIGFVNNPWSYMSKSDIFVLSSYEESFGMVLVEAMACNLPVVATDADVGGPKTVLDNGKFGILVSNGDSDALSKMMLKLLKSSKLRIHYSKLSKERAKVYSPIRIASEMINFGNFIIKFDKLKNK